MPDEDTTPGSAPRKYSQPDGNGRSHINPAYVDALEARAALCDEAVEMLRAYSRYEHFKAFPHLLEGSHRHASGASERDLEAYALLSRLNLAPPEHASETPKE